MKKGNSKYQDNWENIFSEEAKAKHKQLEQELLEKEQLYALELEKKEALEKQKQQKILIKTRIKKML